MSVKYFQFAPEQPMAGVTFTPLTGEVVPGQIIIVPDPMVAAVLSGHADWEESDSKAYIAQAKEQS